MKLIHITKQGFSDLLQLFIILNNKFHYSNNLLIYILMYMGQLKSSSYIVMQHSATQSEYNQIYQLIAYFSRISIFVYTKYLFVIPFMLIIGIYIVLLYQIIIYSYRKNTIIIEKESLLSFIFSQNKFIKLLNQLIAFNYVIYDSVFLNLLFEITLVKFENQTCTNQTLIIITLVMYSLFAATKLIINQYKLTCSTTIFSKFFFTNYDIVILIMNFHQIIFYCFYEDNQLYQVLISITISLLQLFNISKSFHYMNKQAYKIIIICQCYSLILGVPELIVYFTNITLHDFGISQMILLPLLIAVIQQYHTKLMIATLSNDHSSNVTKFQLLYTTLEQQSPTSYSIYSLFSNKLHATSCSKCKCIEKQIFNDVYLQLLNCTMFNQYVNDKFVIQYILILLHSGNYIQAYSICVSILSQNQARLENLPINYEPTAMLYQNTSDLCVSIAIISSFKEILNNKIFYTYLLQSDFDYYLDEIQTSIHQIQEFSETLLWVENQKMLFNSYFLDYFLNLQTSNLCPFINPKNNIEIENICSNTMEGSLKLGLQAVLNYIVKIIISEISVDKFVTRIPTQILEIEGAFLFTEYLRNASDMAMADFQQEVLNYFSILEVIQIILQRIRKKSKVSYSKRYQDLKFLFQFQCVLIIIITNNINMQVDYAFLNTLSQGIQVQFDKPLYVRDPSIPHAPCKKLTLTKEEQKLAIKNALRYFEESQHALLVQELLYELRTYGHIYIYRLIPEYRMKAYSYNLYPCKCKQAQVIMHMIMNNLDHEVAQFPHELVTYGGNGSVFQNWAQFHLTMKYLSEMTEHQTLVMNSGHPQGLFPSHPDAPRIVLSNGMMIPNYSSRDHYEKHYTLGNTMYGQMTAGSYCYIGSQGIVHGTTLTLLNAARKYLNKDSLNGVVFVSSGLGGMSGAQPKAADILGCISVIAEVSEKALDKRLKQGWVKHKFTNVEEVILAIKAAKSEKRGESIGFLGNVILLWERLAEEEHNLVELGSDQTSLHNPFNGGYYPVQLSFEEANEMMVNDPAQFKNLVYESLRRQVNAINKVTAKGMHFWDYGNCFLLESRRAGAEINNATNAELFRYPSYFQDIMGDIFSLGFGPFRWICSSGDPTDLQKTDQIAEQVLLELMKHSPKIVADQLADNLEWIRKADSNKLVIGSQARILYADTQGRTQIALSFNEAIKSGAIKGPVVLSRDHHDVSGTDSPFRETADIYDGSQFTADMAVQNVIGDSFRGATWVALHNGGGVGWGEVVNGGFGLVLDGTDDASRRAKMMLQWDVNNGVARRSWSGNQNAYFNIKRQMEMEPLLKVTLPHQSDVADKLEL